jgi:Asp-tRNA(Asn)/Glu-tRNA(Gln) amidotransferase A subunit family amidase
MPIGFDEHGAPMGLGVFALRDKEVYLITVAHSLETTTKRQNVRLPASVIPE